ncbi:Na+/H+ antiporter [uncultured Rothia sp.]|uniref:Na+/H+ antiporter n=1 Tax=uncultured Rothia sp. TaxID=316088 RepID=UPI003217D8AC
MGLEIVIVVGVAIVLSSFLSERLKLINPVVLMVCGVAIALFVPHMNHLSLPSEIVLAIFLPLLLMWEAIGVPLREIRKMLRGIILAATVLVIATAVSVGIVGHAMGLSLGTALIIGAAVAPTDATAVAALGKGISKQGQIALKAESLINDGTALVVFALALEFATGDESLTFGHGVWLFALSFGGGALIGLFMGIVATKMARYLSQSNAMQTNLVSLLVTFISFFLAEHIGASGVVAVVVCGLFTVQSLTRYIATNTRAVFYPVWSFSTFIINATLFVFVGVQLPGIIEHLESATLARAALIAVVVYLTMMAVRLGFSELMIRVIRLLDRRPSQLQLRTTFRARIVNAVAGFRGAISLAVALSVPLMLGEEHFPERDLILFITSGVVLISLIIQGTLLSVVVRWANANVDTSAESEQEVREVRAALNKGLQLVKERMPQLAKEQGVSAAVLAKIMDEYTVYQALWAEGQLEMVEDDDAEQAVELWRQENRLRLETVRNFREEIISMRDAGEINDQGMQGILNWLDIMELRVTGPVEME